MQVHHHALHPYRVLFGVLLVASLFASLSLGNPRDVTALQPARQIRAAPEPSISISTSYSFFPLEAGMSFSPTYTFNESNGGSGTINSFTSRYYTQDGDPLSNYDGPHGISIAILPYNTTTWNNTFTLPAAVIDGARSAGEYVIIHKTAFYGTSSTGTAFSGEGDYSIYLSPDAFSKKSPSNGSTLVKPAAPVLSWYTPVGAYEYKYCIDTTNNNFCDLRNWIGTYQASRTLSNLLPNTTYYWQVRAYNIFRYSTAANSGNWWSFTTLPYPPSAFGKTRPANGAAKLSTSLTLTWAASTGAASYWICYDKTNDNACSKWINNGPSTSRTLTGLTARATYFWQVRAVNAGGITLANNGTWWKFSTAPLTATFRSTGTQDGHILESSETSIKGGTMNATGTTFNLGDEAGDKQYRAVLSFNTASLPNTAVITRVTLKIKKSTQVGTNPFTILIGLKADIRKPFFGTTTGLVLTDFQALVSRAAVGTFGKILVSNWYTAVIGSTGYPYINKTGTTQFRLYFLKDDNDDMNADYMKFFSGNYATVSARPTLIIEYYVP